MREKNKENPLALCQTKELIEELFNRFDHCVIAGYKVLSENPPRGITVRRIKGNYVMCQGLGFTLSAFAHDSQMADQISVSPKEGYIDPGENKDLDEKGKKL